MSITKEFPENSIFYSKRQMFDLGRCFTMHLPESLCPIQRIVEQLKDDLKRWHCLFLPKDFVVHQKAIEDTGETILSFDSIHYEIRISITRNLDCPDKLQILWIMNGITIWGYICIIAMKNSLPLRMHHIKKKLTE